MCKGEQFTVKGLEKRRKYQRYKIIDADVDQGCINRSSHVM